MKHHEFVHELTNTSSIFGRQSNVQVRFEGNEARTEGDTIYLPNLPIDTELSRSQVQLMRGFVDKEAGHIRHSHTGRLVEFYDRCKNNKREDLGHLQSTIEDLWVEGEVQDEYPGSTKNLHVVNENKSKKILDIMEEIDYTFPSENIQIGDAQLAIEAAGMRDYAGSNTQEIYDMLPDNLREHADNWAAKAKECRSTEEAIKLSKAIYEFLKQDPDLSQPPEAFDGGEGDDMDEGENSDEYKKGKGKGEESSPSNGNPTDEDGQPQSGPSDTQGTKPDPSNPNQGEDGGESEGEGKPGKGHVDFQDTRGSKITQPAEERSSGGGHGWVPGTQFGQYTVASIDHDIKYKRSGTQTIAGHPDRYLEKIVRSTDPSQYLTTKGKISGNVNVMKVKLRRALLAKQQRDWDFGREVGRLDTKRLVSAYNGNRNVYKVRKDRSEADTAITLLVDLSGSMSGPKAKVARDCVLAIAECLDGSNYTFNVVGFSNNGYPPEGRHSDFVRRERLDQTYFKDFNDPYRLAKCSIARIPDATGGNNSDYDFIVDAIRELKKRPESRKVLITFSDGYPAQAGGWDVDLVRFCRQAVTEGIKEGVECVGIGICSDAVENIYPNHVVVNNVNDLSGASFRKLTELLV